MIDPLGRTRSAKQRLIDHRLHILQTAIAAGAAWEIGTLFQPRPYFAPIAAIISVGAAAGQHVRRAIELSFGVAVGIGLGDLLVRWLGTGPLSIGLLVALAMAAAYLFGAGQILVNQTAVSAVLIATLGTPPHVSSFTRFFSAMIGSGVAVIVGPVLFGRDPLAAVGRRAERVLAALADAVDEAAGALAAGDSELAARALEHARDADADLAAFEDAVASARETLRLTPPRRRNLPRLEAYADAAQQVDYAVRNVRVLARAVQTAAARGVPADADLAEALRLLASAMRALAGDLQHPDTHSQARELARQAARDATAVLDRRQDLSANLVVAQIRSTAADILRGSGMETQEMRVVLGPYPGT